MERNNGWVRSTIYFCFDRFKEKAQLAPTAVKEVKQVQYFGQNSATVKGPRGQRSERFVATDTKRLRSVIFILCVFQISFSLVGLEIYNLDFV